MRVWLMITLTVRADLEDALIGRLHENGCLGVETTPNALIAWFDREIPIDSLLLPGCRLESSELVEEEPWQERWMESLAPLTAGRGFLIVPGIDPGIDGGGRRIIRLTPGRAFGTGEHATTRLCLELMEDRIGSGDSVLDVGTGSGILAIAAAMLGARPVLAIDTDETATGVAARNARRNGCDGIRFATASCAALRATRFDHVVANLEAATLLRLMPALAERGEMDLVVSGILSGQESEVAAAASREGLRPSRRRFEGEWVALELVRGRHD